MTRIKLEMESGETLLCNTCGEMFHGDAWLDIDDEAESVEGVVCISCSPHSSNQTVRKEK